MVYSDSAVIVAYVPRISGISGFYLKTKDGVVIEEAFTLGEQGHFLNVKLAPNTQYQVTAVGPLMKESEPFFFTVIDRAKETE